jgi:ankyrin repeat protein
MEHREWWTEHPNDQSFDDVGEDDRCDNLTALMAASWKGPHTLLSKLLTAGAAVNKRDSWGRSPLWIAGETGQLACVQLLVEVGSELDAVSKSGKSALHVAVGAGHVDVVKYLIDKGADVDRTDHSGRTPCHFAAFKGIVPVLELLFKHKARYSWRDSEGLTPVHLAVQQTDNLLAIECLLQHGASPHTPDYNGKTPLHSAAAKGSPAISLLLEARADAAMRDCKGRTAYECLSTTSNIVRQRLASATLHQLPGSAFDARFAIERAEKGRSLSDSSVVASGGDGNQNANKQRFTQENVNKPTQGSMENTAHKSWPERSYRWGFA